MDETIISYIVAEIARRGEASAVRDILDSIDTEIGPRSPYGEIVRAARDAVERPHHATR